MGKVRQIFVWNGKEDLGSFRREELVEQLQAGTVLPSDYFFEKGMSNWERVALLPCCVKFLATEPQRQMLARMGITYSEFLTKAEVSAIMAQRRSDPAGPATGRQLAFLAYLGISVPANLNKSQAGDLIDSALDNDSLSERRSTWRYDRYDLYPDLFAEERAEFKSGRGAALLADYNDFRIETREGPGGSDYLPKLTLAHVDAVVEMLDRLRPGWDRDLRRAMLDDFLPAIEEWHAKRHASS